MPSHVFHSLSQFEVQVQCVEYTNHDSSDMRPLEHDAAVAEEGNRPQEIQI